MDATMGPDLDRVRNAFREDSIFSDVGFQEKIYRCISLPCYLFFFETANMGSDRPRTVV